jgi:hypothetical protein
MERKRVEEALCVLGETLLAFLRRETLSGRYDFRDKLSSAIRRAGVVNPLFTPTSVSKSLMAWGRALQRENITCWMKSYPESSSVLVPRSVAVIMAGNIPLVGMHDFICVLLSGNKVLVKVSDDDAVLLPVMADILAEIEPGLHERIAFAQGTISGFDAVIATGSDNTYRYFDYYFGKHPNLLRKNRNSAAVLTGRESLSNLDDLCHDIFDYFGMGCRSVSKLYVPEKYDFGDLLTLFNAWDETGMHHRYMSNYDYQKSLMLINRIPFLDHRNILLTENHSLRSPLAVVHYEHYHDFNRVVAELEAQEESIQCVAAAQKILVRAVPFGKTQEPELWDYADGRDTMAFLTGLA